MQADSSIQQKQQYLRINILQSGFDPSDFVSFLEKHQNIDHIDIEGWEMDKIIKLVALYKQYKRYSEDTGNVITDNTIKEMIDKQKIGSKKLHEIRKPVSQTQIYSVGSDESAKIVVQREKVKIFQEKNSKIQYPRYSPIFDYQFKASCKCTQSQNLNKVQNLQITLPKFQEIKTEGLFLGFGAKTEYWFTLQTNMNNRTSVKRLISDFDWFSESIIRLYPYLALPELPQFMKENQNPYQKRRIQIQEYLQELAKRQFLMKSSIFMDFLIVPANQIKKLKESIDSTGFPKGVSALRTQTGQIQVEYTKKLCSFEQECHNYSKKVIQAHQNMNEMINKTIESMNIVVNNLNYIVDYFAELHQTYNQLMNKYPEYKSSEYNQILISINNLFHGISDNVKSHSSNIEKHMKDYFKVNLLNDRNVMKLERYIKQEEKNYLDYKYNLYRKKERLLGQPQKWDIDIKKIENLAELRKNKEKCYEIMLPRETTQEEKIKSWVAFLYTNFIKQFNKYYIQNEAKRYAEKYKTFATDLLSKDKNYLEALTNFLHQSRKIVQ